MIFPTKTLTTTAIIAAITIAPATAQTKLTDTQKHAINIYFAQNITPTGGTKEWVETIYIDSDGQLGLKLKKHLLKPGEKTFHLIPQANIGPNLQAEDIVRRTQIMQVQHLTENGPAQTGIGTQPQTPTPNPNPNPNLGQDTQTAPQAEPQTETETETEPNPQTQPQTQTTPPQPEPPQIKYPNILQTNPQNETPLENTLTTRSGTEKPEQVLPNMWIWIPPDELSHGSTITQVIARQHQRLTYPNQKETAIAPRYAIASEASWADALVAANSGRTLLLNESQNLEPGTKTLLEDSLREYKKTNNNNIRPILYIVGGKQAISTNIEQQIKNLGYDTIRLGGTNRYETSVANITKRWWPGWNQLAIVRGSKKEQQTESAAFADTFTALQTAPPHGLALSDTDTLTPPLGALLSTPPKGSFLAKKETTITVFGGTKAISKNVYNAFKGITRNTYYISDRGWFTDQKNQPHQVQRIDGDSRYATNIEYQKQQIEQQNKQNKKNGQPPTTQQPILIIDGAGPHSWQTAYAAQQTGKNKSIILTAGDELTPDAQQFIKQYANPTPQTPVICYSTKEACKKAYTIIINKQNQNNPQTPTPTPTETENPTQTDQET